MNEELLSAVFKELQKAAELDFALTSVDQYGTDTAEVQKSLLELYGESARGIWIRRWLKDESVEQGKNSNLLFVKCSGLTQPEMYNIMDAFAAMRYKVTPCTGKYNLSGHFTIEENTNALIAKLPLLAVTPDGVVRMENNSRQSVRLAVEQGGKLLVAEIYNPDESEFPQEISVFVGDPVGSVCQDICLIRPHCHFSVRQKKFVRDNSFVDCLVWADSDDENYSAKFTISVAPEDALPV